MKPLALLAALLGAFSVSANANSWMQYDQSNSPLPSNSVTATLNDGAITWVGTFDGLAMFNGMDWTIYQSETSILPDDHIHDIYKDTQGNTWVVSGTGLLKINVNGWEVIDLANSPTPTAQLRSIT
jgi:ligand-binding sensor domain-containing protein